MQHFIYNIKSPFFYCPNGQLTNKFFKALSYFFGERNVAKHPYQSPPCAFETRDIYYPNQES